MAGDDYKAERENASGGIVGYLRVQAIENPGPFLSLLGKVLPTQLAGSDGDPLVVQIVKYANDPPAG